MNAKLTLEEVVTTACQSETVKKQQLILRRQPQAQSIDAVRTGDRKQASSPQKQNGRQLHLETTLRLQNARDAARNCRARSGKVGRSKSVQEVEVSNTEAF